MSVVEYSADALNPLVIYADNHLLAVNKPPGLLTQDSGTGKRNLEDWAREWVRLDKGKPGNVFLNAVHRIDRVVSGVVLFARTSKALSRLNEDVRKRNCRKVYHALVEGTPSREAAELTHWLKHENHQAVLGRAGEKNAQEARLRYYLVKKINDRSLLEVNLETGRYHQIRAQLAAIECPIVGDVRYGAVQAKKSAGIALHHFQLEIIHPTRKEPIKMEADYPESSFWISL